MTIKCKGVPFSLDDVARYGLVPDCPEELLAATTEAVI